VTGGGKPAVSSFTIKADAVVMRGEAIGFTVTRSGPLPAVEIPYDIAQGSDVVAETAGKPHTLNFGEGVTSLPITIAPDNYTLCGDPLTVTLRTAPENPAAATAAFLGYMPDDCRRPPMSFWDRVQRSIDADPLWWGLGLLLVLTGVAASIWLLKRRPVRPDSPEVEDPSAPVSADCTIEPGTVALLDRDPQADRWPEIAAQVTIEPGSTLAPQPLPIREPTDE
jgi:hypothetical protein